MANARSSHSEDSIPCGYSLSLESGSTHLEKPQRSHRITKIKATSQNYTINVVFTHITANKPAGFKPETVPQPQIGISVCMALKQIQHQPVQNETTKQHMLVHTSTVGKQTHWVFHLERKHRLANTNALVWMFLVQFQFEK